MSKNGKFSHILAVKRLADFLREYRVKNNITREELANLTDISPRYIADLENCEKKISVEYLAKIKNAIDIDVNYILTGNI